MRQEPEPSVKGGFCSYCGDAQVSHTLYFVESFISSILDPPTHKFNNLIPRFVKNFADRLLVFLLNFLSLFRIVGFSSDIGKATTFRSKIIWEEARQRGISMEQVVFFGKPLDHYRARVNGTWIYFESIPLKPGKNTNKDWDDKIFLKQELLKQGIPVPAFREAIYNRLAKPLVVKPRSGSRGRHTITNITTPTQLADGIRIARQLSSQLIIEEHLYGDVCRATFVDGVLAGFYRGQAASIVGNGTKTIRELIEEKDNRRPSRVEPIRITQELHDLLARSEFAINDVLPACVSLPLSHRIGRLFGGTTKEMIDELHPSFIPILQKAERVAGLSVVGFDCIIPDPTKDASTQKWGIIECNTLPFIDLHYYALEGKPRNIAGMIWDMWK